MKMPKALKRDRVNKALENIFSYPLTVIEAPIGYGKTTAVRDFLSINPKPVLWISFLSSDDTTSFYWNSFSEHITKLDKDAGTRLKSLGFPIDASQTSNVISILNSLDFKENTVFAIDDFHFVKNPQISSFISIIIKDLPENLHFVIITRDTSLLDISELTIKGLCNILPQQALCFTNSEIKEYCSLMGCNLNETELKKLSEYTGGWISMVYLSLLGIKQSIAIGKNDMIDELVEKVLFNIYDEKIQSFLLELSAMDTFTVEQAEFVTEEPQTEEFLKKLRQENAFIAYNNTDGSYKIHNVLLDFLRIKQRDDKKRRSLYRRIGEWYLSKKTYMPAKSYFFRAGEANRILELLDNEDSITYGAAYFEGFFELFAGLSRETLFQYPLAYIQYILKLLVNRYLNSAKDGLARLNELQSIYENGNFELSQKNRILAEISLVRMFSVFNDVERMRDCLFEARRLLGEKYSLLIKRKAEFTFASPHMLYIYYKQLGRLKETAEFMVTEFPIYPLVSDGCGTGCEYLALAEYALETGEFETAELNASKAIFKASTKEQTCIIICANFTLIRLYIYQGRIIKALELLKQLRIDVPKENNAFYNTALDLIDGYCYACLGLYNSIPAWLQAGDMSPAQLMYQGLAFNYIVYGKAMLLSKNYIKLEVLAEEFKHYFSVFQNQLGFIHNKILNAIAKYQLYGMNTGCTVLNEAITMAKEDNIVLPFAEYAPFIIDMLKNIQHFNLRDIYIKTIIEACQQYISSLRKLPKNIASLSEREIEILTLTAKGLKREQIALQLHLATGTVKNYLENIYRKLEANGKMEAVKKAQELNLI